MTNTNANANANANTNANANANGLKKLADNSQVEKVYLDYNDNEVFNIELNTDKDNSYIAIIHYTANESKLANALYKDVAGVCMLQKLDFLTKNPCSLPVHAIRDFDMEIPYIEILEESIHVSCRDEKSRYIIQKNIVMKQVRQLLKSLQETRLLVETKSHAVACDCKSRSFLNNEIIVSWSEDIVYLYESRL